ncbi:MAG: sensory box protein [Chthoniobacteraceae bacterium]|nr:sensory box protein [Chthoniobacteraceae bacterium]
MTRILIVDDKEDNLYYLRTLLTGEGSAVESASDGIEALVKARLNPPDLIVSDLLMPVMDGYTLLRHWKADEHLKKISFIVYTATYTEEQDRRLALSLGADAFILKPAEPEDFLARIREVQAKGAAPMLPGEPCDDEKELLKLYSETLIRKLEQKTLQLEETNRALQHDIAERKTAETAQRQMGETQMAILNALPAHIALIDAHGIIVSVNESWRRFDTANMLHGPEFFVGQDYLAMCGSAAGACFKEAREAAAGIRRVLHGQAKEFVIEYSCHLPAQQCWYRLMVTPLHAERLAGAVVMHINITERMRHELALKLAEGTARESKERLDFALESAEVGDWSLDLLTNRAHRSLRHDQCFGYSEAVPQWGYDTFLAHIQPEDREHVDAAFQKAMAGRGDYNDEFRTLWSDGSVHWLWTRGRFYFDQMGKPCRFAGIVTDITARKQAELEVTRVNRALQMLSTCNEALIRAEVEHELLERVCQIAVETGGYRMAWVGYAQGDANRSIKPMAHAGTEDGYLSAIKVSWNENDPQGHGLAGQVIRSGQAVVCEDFSRDPTMAHWRALAEQRGYRGVIFLPLRDGKQAFGFLGLYSAEISRTSADELKLLQELADNLAFGIVNARARLDRQRLQTAVMSVAAGVSAATGTEFYENLAGYMAAALGGQAGFVSQLRSGEALSATTLAAVVDGAVVENFDYFIEGTPCAKLSASETCVVAQQVVEEFPGALRLAALGAQAYVGRRLDGSNGQPLGHLFVIFREPLKDVEFVTSTLQIFAARAASELERQQTDAQVREQAALIDEARDAIVVRDLEHRVTFWSKGAERLYGWTAPEARGCRLEELLEVEAAIFAEADRAVRETGEWNGEIHKHARDASIMTLNSRWTLMRNAHGEPQSILSIDTDITERKKIEQQFLRAQRMESIGTLAGGIAHDLNNVLGPIMISLEVLKMRFPDPASAKLISILDSSAQRGADMVRQVLSFARGVEGRRMELQIRHIIQEIEKIANDTFLKHIQVRTIIPYDLWTVVGDPTQMHQVLLNLCVNARDAMPDGGTLTISAENRFLDTHYAALNLEAKAGPYVSLQVEDTGIGMPPEIIEKIFDPFFTTKEVGKGTGLGLSTSLAIVKSHGGFFRVSSEPLKGTRFKLYIPAKTEATAETAAKVAAELPLGNGELILVVDDEAAVRQITQATLEAFGYQVLLACDGAEAVAIYATRRAEIAAVLTDMTMPVMDGLATIQVLRKLNSTLRIIAASGLSSSGDVARACGSDIKHFIAKPYTADALLKVLQQTLAETD